MFGCFFLGGGGGHSVSLVNPRIRHPLEQLPLKGEPHNVLLVMSYWIGLTPVLTHS